MNAKHSRVLIVSASTGTGHVRAAEALREAALRHETSPRVEHVDLLELAPRWIRTVYGSGYEWLVACAPRLWQTLYHHTDGPDADHARWGATAHRVLFRAFRHLLTTGGWDLCLCTHFLPCQLAAGRAGLPPFSLVITDFGLHRFWVQPGVRRYFVATHTLAATLRLRVQTAHVEATGIPIAPGFAAAPSREEARAALGLGVGRRVALVMGGGLGLGIEHMADAVLTAHAPGLQVVAMCGRNQEAKARLEARRLPDTHLRVLGYTTGVERYLAAADLVVTKPGGLTASEALALGRPLLLTHPVPGQEEANTSALTGAGAALAAPDPAALRDAVRALFAEPDRLKPLAQAAQRIGRPNAAAEIVGHVCDSQFAEAA